MQNRTAQRIATSAIFVAGFSLLGAGCKSPVVRADKNDPVTLNELPIQNDPALQTRQWDETTSNYPSGATIASPRGFFYAPNPQLDRVSYSAVQVPLFVGQTIALPVAFVIENPWKDKRYAGAITRPTYNAMPLLPPSRDPEINAEQNVPQPPPPAAKTKSKPKPQKKKKHFLLF